MNFDQSANQTPMYASHDQSQGWELSTPAAKRRGWASNRTQFVSAGLVPSPVRPLDITSVQVRDDALRVKGDALVRSDDEISREAEVIRDRRLQLLVSQFANQTTTEDDARLMILTERLRRQVPTVSAGAMEAVEAAAEAIDDADQTLAELHQLYGI